jgi:hypothetical protein
VSSSKNETPIPADFHRFWKKIGQTTIYNLPNSEKIQIKQFTKLSVRIFKNFFSIIDFF